MAIEIRVGPPYITINQGKTFMVTERNGEISDNEPTGLYTDDTRFISYYRFYINRQGWKLVNASQVAFYAARIHLTNPSISTEDGEIAKHTLSLTIDRVIGSALTEAFAVENYAGKKVKFSLELAMRSDFADVFEVKANKVVQKGTLLTTWDDQQHILRTSYDHHDFHRAVTYTIIKNDAPLTHANGRLIFDIELEPLQRWTACMMAVLEHGQRIDPAIFQSCADGQQATPASGAAPGISKDLDSAHDQRQAKWQATCTNIETSNQSFHSIYRQAIEDMGALRIYDMDVSDDAWIPAGGLPWFATLFGRDSLTVSYQNMAISTGFALGALKRLAEFQATERDDWTDAQPGKIMHEIRFGDLTHFHKIPFTPFYATADATILYLIVLSEAYRWTANKKLLTDHRDVIAKCLHWIDHYGDKDGDGFQEYETYSSYHYENVSWKDASDAVVYADGSQVKQPKGTCELQGYVYDAKTRMAEIFETLGEQPRAQALRQQAQELKRRFNQVFWMEDEGCYAFALDPEKQLATSVASNTGHCLWSGIADAEKAARVARRLLQEDMWSGWGIRTLSSKNRAYNPLSYQRGSVWPQDNGIIAAGFKRYGLINEANQVIQGMFDAIQRFEYGRPPEVFAGLQRRGPFDFPALYPGGANIPQAWATGSIFHMLRTMLGLRADAPNKRLYVRPTLPDWLSDITLRHLRVGPCSLSLCFWREGSRSRWEVLNISADKGTDPNDMIRVLDETEHSS
jgi:glycogen debranching enzyme